MAIRLYIVLISFSYFSAYAACPSHVAAHYTCPMYGPNIETWENFYTAGDESSTIVVLAGDKMVPYVSQAIREKNMYLRRYAIIALGYMKNKSVIEGLNFILNDPEEEDYFRGDALQSIFFLNESLGNNIASKLLKGNLSEDNYLRLIAEEIVKNHLIRHDY